MTYSARAAESATGNEFFENKIRPILVDNCYPCHSSQSAKIKGGLLLDTRDGVLKGGDSGPAIKAGDVENSLLIKAVRYTDDDLRMPPKNKKLATNQIADLETWVKMGAPDPRTAPSAPNKFQAIQNKARTHWAFQPVREPAIPSVKHKSAVQTPVDNFVLAKLEAASLRPSPKADKRTLIRRATFDLTGLPPTPAEFAAFVADKSPQAFARVVDRLLASPRYGERWGRHWLDVARYSDTKGYVFEEDRHYPYAYTYRDYVIRAFNEDLPYNEFIKQQIAADLLPSATDKRSLAALGYLTLGRRFINNINDIIDDRIDVVCRGMMGLTVGCARCHDHKFDPIPSRDYYSLYGVFASSMEPTEEPLLGMEQPSKARDEYLAEHKRRLDARDKYRADQESAMTAQLRSQAGEYLTAAGLALAAPDSDVDGIAHARKLQPSILRRWMTSLKDVPLEARWFAFGGLNMPAITGEPDLAKDALANLTDEEFDVIFDTPIAQQLRALQRQVDELDATSPGAPPRAMALLESPSPHDTHIFIRGNPGNQGAEAPREFLEVLSGPDRKPFQKGSGRLELAEAIASPENPLTARVLVNRVWMHHFGSPLVATPSDFGLRSDPPSNPELLDFLAARFVADGWSIKKLHRLIMLSSAYQQSSENNAANEKIDPDNRLFWRMNRQRLEFEAMRDTLLAVAGKLDLTVGGHPVDIINPDATRRTVYGYIDRQNLPDLFRAFDLASPDSSSPRRFYTTVPQQALFLMNSPFIIEQAKSVVNRPDFKSAATEQQRLRLLYEVAFQREPSRDEMQWARQFIDVPGAAPVSAATNWLFGYGAFDEAKARVKSFQPLPFFDGHEFQGGPVLPDPKLGWVMLTDAGGHPGNDQAHAVIRRWVAPRDGTITIKGTLVHPEPQGDGVRGRIVSSRLGLLGQWLAHNSKSATDISSATVRRGDSIDFVVDCYGTCYFDSFGWAPTIRFIDDTQEWNATKDFADAAHSVHPNLDAWQQYAQVLLMSNELIFVD